MKPRASLPIAKIPLVPSFCLMASIGLISTHVAAFAQATDSKSPLVLRAQGSFYVGGTIEHRSPNGTDAKDAKFSDGDIAVNQMYVQYQIPETLKYKYPIVLMHGGGHTGAFYETTPDGREGWYTSLARRGFAVYAVDAPNRGRSGYDPTARFAASQGLKPASDMEAGNIYSAQSAWLSFRWGPKYGEAYKDTQFPLDHTNDYMKEVVPSYRDAQQYQFILTDLEALVDRIGPCILLGWSTGSGNVMMAATHRVDKVKALIAIEGVPPDPTRSPVDVGEMAKIPLLAVHGDNTQDNQINSLIAARDYTTKLAKIGGVAELVYLPDRGLHGNGHTMALEHDNEQIADIIESWVAHNARQ